MSTRQRTVRAMMLIVVALAAGACATTTRRADTAAPIESVASIAGSWAGTLDFGAGEQPCTLVIEPGGRAVMQGQIVMLQGTVAVQAGKGTYDFTPRSSGTVTLYRDGSKRELQFKGTGGTFEAWVTPK